MTSLSQAWVVPMEDVGDQKQESTMDSIEGKDWSPSYLNLECLCSFMNFVTGLV
jgi:hypothetical protein